MLKRHVTYVKEKEKSPWYVKIVKVVAKNYVFTVAVADMRNALFVGGQEEKNAHGAGAREEKSVVGAMEREEILGVMFVFIVMAEVIKSVSVAMGMAM